MTKKIIYLCTILLLLFSCSAFAAAKDNDASIAPADTKWQVIDMGPAESYSYAFDTDTIRYERSSDGSINKNIIVYDEKKTNIVSMSSEFNYYSITKCKINIEMQTVNFGDESFYTKKDKFRWTNTPIYSAWITVKPETIGGIRFVTLVEYAKAHDAELMAHSQL